MTPINRAARVTLIVTALAFIVFVLVAAAVNAALGGAV